MPHTNPPPPGEFFPFGPPPPLAKRKPGNKTRKVSPGKHPHPMGRGPLPGVTLAPGPPLKNRKNKNVLPGFPRALGAPQFFPPPSNRAPCKSSQLECPGTPPRKTRWQKTPPSPPPPSPPPPPACAPPGAGEGPPPKTPRFPPPNGGSRLAPPNGFPPSKLPPFNGLEKAQTSLGVDREGPLPLRGGFRGPGKGLFPLGAKTKNLENQSWGSRSPPPPRKNKPARFFPAPKVNLR